MTGDDVVLGAETGSGKTLAYLLPVMHALTQRPPPRYAALTAGDCSDEKMRYHLF
jgi:superfamily II DNA/RNA helicase